MLAWTEQVKFRGLCEQPNDIQVTTKQHKNRNWNNLNKFEPQQQNRHKTVSYKLEIVFYTKTDVSTFLSPNIVNILDL